MENLEVTIQLPNLKLNRPKIKINLYNLEKIIFDLTRKIGQKLLKKLLQIIDDRLMTESERGSLYNQGKRLRYMMTTVP